MLKRNTFVNRVIIILMLSLTMEEEEEETNRVRCYKPKLSKTIIRRLPASLKVVATMVAEVCSFAYSQTLL